MNVSSWRHSQIKLTHYDDTKKIAHDSQIVRAKKNLKLSYSGPSQRQALGTDQNACILTIKVTITTAADDKFCDIFPNFRQK